MKEMDVVLDRVTSRNESEYCDFVVCNNCGRTMLVNLEQKKNMIKPADIFTLETAGLSESAKKILSEQKPIQMKITMDSVVKYLCENIHDIEKFKSDS